MLLFYIILFNLTICYRKVYVFARIYIYAAASAKKHLASCLPGLWYCSNFNSFESFEEAPVSKYNTQLRQSCCCVMDGCFRVIVIYRKHFNRKSSQFIYRFYWIYSSIDTLSFDTPKSQTISKVMFRVTTSMLNAQYTLMDSFPNLCLIQPLLCNICFLLFKVDHSKMVLINIAEYDLCFSRVMIVKV